MVALDMQEVRTQLEMLHDFLEGTVIYETEASAEQSNRIAEENKEKPVKARRVIADGFAEGSQAYEFAKALGLSIEEQQSKEPEGTADLFHEPLFKRYWLAEDFWNIFPMRFGGPDPDDACTPESEYFEGAVAWDEDYILFPCPRGVCMIGREDWQKGCRQCRGC